MRVIVDWLDPDAADGNRLRSTPVEWPDVLPLPVFGDRIVVEGENVPVGNGRVFVATEAGVAVRLSCGSPGGDLQQ